MNTFDEMKAPQFPTAVDMAKETTRLYPVFASIYIAYQLSTHGLYLPCPTFMAFQTTMMGIAM